MKTGGYVSSLLNAIFGHEEKVKMQRDPEQHILDEAWKTYCKRLQTSGYVIQSMERPFTLVDKTTIELTYSNYRSSQMLRVAIERLDVGSTALGKRMLILSILMLILSIIMSILVAVQVYIMVKGS